MQDVVDSGASLVHGVEVGNVGFAKIDAILNLGDILPVAGGKVVDATSNNAARLNAILDSDDGARYIGEFALGFNPYIQEPMRDILFDEKIAGSTPALNVSSSRLAVRTPFRNRLFPGQQLSGASGLENDEYGQATCEERHTDGQCASVPQLHQRPVHDWLSRIRRSGDLHQLQPCAGGSVPGA